MATTGYSKLLEISLHMVELAKHQEWEALTAAESERNSLLAKVPPKPADMSLSDINAMAKAIREIQDCDRAILDYVTPWREHAETLLSRLDPAR